MDYERYMAFNSKETLFDKGLFSLGMGCTFTLYSVVPFVMRENLESLVTHSVNPINYFLQEVAEEYVVSGTLVGSAGVVLMGLGASYFHRSHKIEIPPTKEYIED
ncbi:hypothetical protein HQ489_01205 [Candidatus Woesearchaeota archaeon]|nr:hypothetical protein [Candidatus Woesearchaeota archaeon]